MTAMALSRQRGVSLVAATFLIVVLAGLGVVATRIGVLQNQTASSALRAAQAFHAARIGIAWGAKRALDAGWCGSTSFSLGEGGTAGFSVAVECTQSVHNEAGTMINVFVLDSLAESGSYGGPDYVSRRIQAKVVQ